MKLSNTAAGFATPAPQPSSLDDASTGLPWPTTWRGVYLFVIGSFVLWVLLLAALAEIFS